MKTAIDLFAGAGGFSTGAALAGVDVLWAANHWPEAVAIHELNHQGVEHSCQDLMQADWSSVPDHDILLASPACQGHSTASQPQRIKKHDADRNTAWAVITAAEVRRPHTILVENVKPFTEWTLFPAWLDCLERLGYRTRVHLFDTADFGVPQNRLRVIVSARLGEALDLVNPELPHTPFDSCIDWDQEDGWAPVVSKPPGVQKRVAAGRARGLGDRFLVHYSTGHRGRDISRPIGTITTKAQWAIVDGERTRMLNRDEYRRAMGFPSSYILPDSKKLSVRLLGNAIPVQLSREIVAQASA